MKFVAILYVLASCFLTAAVTQCWTRAALEDRIERRTKDFVAKLDPVKDAALVPQIWMLSARMRMRMEIPCEMAFALAAPFLACLYGAVSSHRALARGENLSVWKKLGEMALVFLAASLLVALALPC